MIAHVPMNTHPNPRRVGRGLARRWTIREVIKHDSVEKAALVEIDELVIQAVVNIYRG